MLQSYDISSTTAKCKKVVSQVGYTFSARKHLNKGNHYWLETNMVCLTDLVQEKKIGKCVLRQEVRFAVITLQSSDIPN